MRALIIGNKSISTPLWDIIMDIKRQLTNGKLKIIRMQGANNIRLTCPHHKNGLEKDADCCVYIGDTVKGRDGKIVVDYGWMDCFACGEKGPFWHFVAECFDKTDEWAKKWLIDNYSDGIVEYIQELEPITLIKGDSSVILEDNILDQFQDYHPYMTERKLTKDVIKEFEIKYNPLNKCLVFPVRDERGRLIMFTQRSVENKKFIIDADKQKPVYLLYHLKKNNVKEAFVCESQINALTCQSYGLPGIALFGTGAANQYNILNKCGIRHYILCFDGDAAGRKGVQKFLENIRKDVLITIIDIPDGKDVNDLSKEEFFHLLQKAGLNYV